MKRLSIILAGIAIASWMLFSGFNTQAVEENEPESITWVSMEEAVQLAQKDGKKILVDFTTVWCRWCKVMDRETYSKADVIKYINANFHAVKFDAEKTTKTFTINGQTYKHRPEIGRNGIHEWAVTLMQGRPSYPTTSFLDSNSKLITNVPGYHKPDEMLMILNFLGEDAYLNQTWQQFQKNYKSS
ncbi:MAG: DUF255 domain-containing protein [Bacteroidota bacterium]